MRLDRFELITGALFALCFGLTNLGVSMYMPSLMFGGKKLGPYGALFEVQAFWGLMLEIVCLPLVFVFGSMFSLAVGGS